MSLMTKKILLIIYTDAQQSGRTVSKEDLIICQNQLIHSAETATIKDVI